MIHHFELRQYKIIWVLQNFLNMKVHVAIWRHLLFQLASNSSSTDFTFPFTFSLAAFTLHGTASHPSVTLHCSCSLAFNRYAMLTLQSVNLFTHSDHNNTRLCNSLPTHILAYWLHIHTYSSYLSPQGLFRISYSSLLPPSPLSLSVYLFIYPLTPIYPPAYPPSLVIL